MIYKDAEIYLVECTHPDYTHLRYLGLDTKKDPNYLGSSTVGKWWINYLGRRYFRKSILETITGTMGECCALEQKYILQHNAVKSPNYFNMNGERKRSSVEDMPVSLEYVVNPASDVARDYINQCMESIRSNFGLFTASKRLLAKNIVCMLLYGNLKYDQEDFEYNYFGHYGSCRPEDTQEVLSSLSSADLVDFDSINIYIGDKLLEKMPVVITHEHFEVLTISN